jgi:hypothetical protein
MPTVRSVTSLKWTGQPPKGEPLHSQSVLIESVAGKLYFEDDRAQSADRILFMSPTQSAGGIPERSGALPSPEEVLLSRWACGVPAVISSVSHRDSAALREMTRLGLKPWVAITVETGTRNASMRVRIGDRTDSVRLSQALASGISVTARQSTPRLRELPIHG